MTERATGLGDLGARIAMVAIAVALVLAFFGELRIGRALYIGIASVVFTSLFLTRQWRKGPQFKSNSAEAETS